MWTVLYQDLSIQVVVREKLVLKWIYGLAKYTPSKAHSLLWGFEVKKFCGDHLKFASFDIAIVEDR